jgi:hypothetical protein
MIFNDAVKKALKMEIMENDFRFKPLRLNTIGKDFLDKYIYNKDKFPILEGLIKTFPIEVAKKHFDKIYGIGDQFYIDEVNGVKVAYITIPNVALNIQIIEKGMEFYGYYLAASHPVPNAGENAIQLDFEPKFQDPCNDKVREQKVLYHITPTNNVEKILKMGLCPKSKNSKTFFPDRIYVLSEYILKKEIEFLALELKKYHNDKSIENGYSLLTIDVNKIPKNVNFRIDGNTNGGFWTYDVIPPDCIVGVEEINFLK